MADEDHGIGYARRAQFYRVEFAEQRDIDFYLSHIQKGESTVLEIPCGAGRLTLELARKARQVTAVDIEPRMLDSLQSHVISAGLESKVQCLLGDMTKLELGSIFDLIIVPSEALQLVPKHAGRLVLACLAKNLKPGGRMIFDTATFSEVRAGDPDYFDPATIGETWVRQWARALPGHGTLHRSGRATKDSEKITFEFLYKVAENSKSFDHEFSEEMTLYLYEGQWFFENIPPGIAEISMRPYYDNARDLSQPSRLIVTMKRSDMEEVF